MTKTDIATPLHGALSIEEIRDALTERVDSAGGGGWAILFHDGRAGRFSVRVSDPDLGPEIPASATETLLSIYKGERFGRLSARGGTLLAPSLPPVRFSAPLEFRGERYGLFVLLGDRDFEEGPWDDAAKALSVELVKLEMAGAADEEAATARTKLDALNEAGDLVRYVDLDVLLPKLMELSLRIMDAQVGAVVLEEEGRFRTGVEWGLTEEVATGLRTRDGGSFLRAVIDGGVPLLINDGAESDRIDTRGVKVNIRSLLAVPLVTPVHALGAILIVNTDRDALDAAHSEVLATIANLASGAIDNALLYKKALETERISAEMQLARRIQQSLLPLGPPELDGVQLEGWSIACSETGGDYYDFIDMGEGKTGIVIGDATGHGMGAALMMFIVRSILHALLTKSRDLVDIVSTMNTMVERDTQDDRFMTFFFGVLDRKCRRLVYTSAGHDPAILYRPGEGKFTELESTGAPLGIVGGAEYPAEEIILKPGDCLLFGTDGIWEARNPEGEAYGLERLRRIIAEFHDEDLREISRRVKEDVIRFRGDGRQRDDITAVFMKLTDGGE
ncbi:MAG: GAF domain-containing SpoIIE family protein phosphatase [Candidatus Eisenbacteria bacterium]